VTAKGSTAGLPLQASSTALASESTARAKIIVVGIHLEVIGESNGVIKRYRGTSESKGAAGPRITK
jgi:hypothetical protein